MRDESGIALPLVMGLLVVLSLIGAGLLSQTITSTKFYESAGISYVGLWNENLTGALQDLDKPENVTNLLKGNLVTGIGSTLDLLKDPNRITLITVLYAISSGNVWTPDWNQTFNNMSTKYNNMGVWSINKQQSLQDSTITSTFFTTANQGNQGRGNLGNQGSLEETLFLFKDSSQLACWNSYNLHVEFNAELSPKFGVYYNANEPGQGKGQGQNFFANLFLISLIEGTFSINTANPGTIPPGQSKSVSFDEKDKNGDYILPSFKGWANASSLGTGVPFNAWHQIDISVQSQGQGSMMTTTVKVDNVVVLTDVDKVKPNLAPNMVGLSNWSNENWGRQDDPPSVTFRNVSVMNTTPP
jgi:hypothetical protein